MNAEKLLQQNLELESLKPEKHKEHETDFRLQWTISVITINPSHQHGKIAQKTGRAQRTFKTKDAHGDSIAHCIM